ncbi:MAG: PhnD/SsuA/transferrin family substrate-binding protein, partial [Candidatus Binatia bacterium]
MANLCARVFALALALLVIGACGKSSPSSKVLRVGFSPAEDAQQVIRNAQPLVEILQKKLGIEVQPFVATDYTGVVEALRVGKLDIA